VALAVVAAATLAVLLTATNQAQPPPLVLPQGVQTHVLVQKYGHGDAALHFTVRPHARWEVVCRMSEEPPGTDTLPLKVLGIDGEDFGWAYCPTGASDTLPPTRSGLFTIVIDTSTNVSWGFEVVTPPHVVPTPGS
jgi:hypothetical protein